ncbi:hypothetical protein CY34DRAFT_19454 [Suillus luteus UH-Slu-Lm8-n1]|uniref:Uncharacterized protein n=1 Tax=Suillus luteus UH-Slu-Lm8-n1 TaxID=930992 RepID=A0A0D0A179_9AGAM|nr:hypothetical protein CY34DRAFT_19454 [Suillus luteus UH-Slu-Lm8-n1]
MDKAGATALLDFWYDRQQKKLRPIFCFKAWKDTDGEMEPPAKAYQKLIHWLSNSWKKAHHVPKSAKASKQAPKHVEDTEESLDDREEYQSSNDGEAAISDHRREPPAMSDQRVICRSSHRNNKAHAVTEECLDERDDGQPSSNDGEEASISKAREHSPLASGDSSEAYQGPGIVNKPPAPKTVNRPPLPKAAKTAMATNSEMELTLVPTTRSGKRRGAPPISDTLAKRTRSKVTLIEPAKPRWGRK